jgi:cell division topological specificity factor
MGVRERLKDRRRATSRSRQIAKERLRLVLAHDRSNISPALLERLKDELIEVISRHIDIDAENVQVTFSQSPRESRLVADIPLEERRERRRE